jgi:hypothetical protein
MANPDDIHAALNKVAGSIDVGDMETARAGVRSTLYRRRRRTRIAAGLGTAVLLVGGVVAFAAFDNSDEPATLVGVDSTTTTIAGPSEDEPDDTPATTQPDASSAPAVQPSTESTSVAVVSGQGAAISSPNVGAADGPGQQWLVPWEDGFLAIAPIYEPQTLPGQLPDDIRSLFPEEVLELFPDGLPPTVAEATTILEEAGLLDVVTEIISSNAEANSAILGAPIGPPSLETSFTVDGTTWESFEMTLPVEINDVRSVLSVGDRLVVMSLPSFGPSGQEGGVQLAATTDLTTWSIQTIDLPPPTTELPDYVNRYVGVHDLATNESGWVVLISDDLDINVESLLPDDVFDPTTEGGFGYGTSDEGVEVFLGDEDNEPLRYTWDELGVSPDVVELMHGGSINREQLWTASWDGSPVRSELTSEFGGTTIATESGFLSVTDRGWFSEDGISWSATDLDGVTHVNQYMNYDGGVIVVGMDEDGLSSLYRVDSRGQSAELIEVPGLPDQVHGAGFSESAGGAITFDANVPEINTDPVILQIDGYELSMSMNTGAYELRDSAGEIVLSEDEPSALGSPSEEPDFRQDNDGWSFSDPQTGEVLAFFPSEVVDAAVEEHFGPPPGEYDDPDFWLVATADGERFIVENIEEGFENGWPILTAINGDTMLVFSDGSWSRYTFS